MSISFSIVFIFILLMMLSFSAGFIISSLLHYESQVETIARIAIRDYKEGKRND